MYESLALIPIGGGNFILLLNGTIRKKPGKGKGATLYVKIEVDTSPVQLSPELMECLSDEPAALQYFNKLPGSHQKYYVGGSKALKQSRPKQKELYKQLQPVQEGRIFVK
jgi:uncharacterized protein YdeI (YjbR/CyaY-like superfamily)